MYKEYFKEIFETSKSVIIPGLGSFSKTGPDDPKITFNPYLKFNDGFLAGFIAKKQNIAMDDAGKLITENVEKINAALEQKGEALVLGLGVLKKTPDGKLEFTTDTQVGVNIPVQKQEPDIKKPEEKPVVKPTDPPKPEVKPEIKPTPPQPEIKPEKEKPVEKPVEPLKNMKVEAPGLTNVEPPGKNVKKEKTVKAPKPPKPPKAPKPPRVKGEKKKFPLVLVIVLALLVGAGTFTAIQWDMVKGWLGMGEHKELAENKAHEKDAVSDDSLAVAQPVDTVVVENTTQEQPVEEVPVKENPVKQKPVQNNYSSSGNYHVIVNCFSVEQNANRMVEKLNAEGHQGHNLGLRGGFFMVEAGSFSSMEEAQSKLNAVKGTYPKAWIYAGS